MRPRSRSAIVMLQSSCTGLISKLGGQEVPSPLSRTQHAESFNDRCDIRPDNDLSDIIKRCNATRNLCLPLE